MVGILLGDHMSQQSRPGQALLDRLGGLAGGDDLALAVRAGVGTAHVFDDEQARRLVVELLAVLLADLDPGLATLRAAAFGLGQLVDTGAREGDPWARPCGRGGRAFFVGAVLGSGSAVGPRLRGRVRRGHRLEGIGDEQGLIGVEAFGARAVETPQEEVEAVLQLLVLAPGLRAARRAVRGSSAGG